MIRYLAKRAFDSFRRRYDYDTDYLTELADSYPAKTWRYILTSPLALHHRFVPAELYFAAKLRSTVRADCGDCARLALRMAREAGVAKSQLQAILNQNPGRMDRWVEIGYRYADAVLDRSADLDGLIREIEIEFGRRGLWDMTFAVAFGQFYPQIKAGLGVQVSCLPAPLMAQEIDGEDPLRAAN